MSRAPETVHNRTRPVLADLLAHKAANEKQYQDREARIAACEVEASDCWMSMWANDATRGKLTAQIKLAEQNYEVEFWVLCTLDGKMAKGREVMGTWGWRWNMEGKWMNSYHGPGYMTPRQMANLEKKGYKWVKMKLTAHLVEHYGNIGSPVHYSYAPDEVNVISRMTDY
jgi:hypothetical protein